LERILRTMKRIEKNWKELEEKMERIEKNWKEL
jgi:hypothetical protein